MDINLLVLKKLLDIPKGKVTTYGCLAKVCDLKSPRYIGKIMAKNDRPDIYPCYKVVASDGALTGYSAEGGLEIKKKMLEADGVVFKNNGKVDLEKSLYSFVN